MIASFDECTVGQAAMEALAAKIRSEGWAIIDGAISLDLVDAIADDLLRLERDLGIVPAHNLFEGLHTTRIYNLLAHGTLYERIPVHPNVLPVVGEGARSRPAHLLAFVHRHRTRRVRPADSCRRSADPLAQTAPARSSATRCGPSPTSPRRTAPPGCAPERISPTTPPTFSAAYESIPAEMAKGSVLVWVGSLWHGGGANTTDERRVGIAMNYCAGFIRQQENQQLGIPIDTIRIFPRRLQELCGFSIYRGLMGHIDKQDPRKAVLGIDRDAALVWDASRVRSW